MTTHWFSVAFTAWGSPVTWLEVVAFFLSLWMVQQEMKVRHWAWPLSIAASAAYAGLFANSKLYGEAGLQLFFIAISLWGWWLWLKTTPSIQRQPEDSPLAQQAPKAPSLAIRRMQTPAVLGYAFASAGLFSVIGLLLAKATNSDVPWLDAAPTALSVVAQILLARKYIETWLVWIVVNVLSTGLFAYKALYLTSLLYGIFAVLSVFGWHIWRASLNTKA